MTAATTEERESVVDDDILGNPVDVYRNLHADNDSEALSVRSRVTETYGLVLTHSPSVIVQTPSFEIQPSGLERFKESGVKNGSKRAVSRTFTRSSAGQSRRGTRGLTVRKRRP